MCACVYSQYATPPPTQTGQHKVVIMSAFFPVTPLLSACPLALKASLSSCWEPRALMDQRRMDAEGGRVLHRRQRARKLAVVVAVQNVLVAVCLLVTVYVYWEFQKKQNSSGDIVHMQFDPISVPPENTTVKFFHVGSSHMMDLNDEKNMISFKCTGPYIWHMYVCYNSLEGEETRGSLQLQVVGSDAPPVSSVTLKASHEERCWGLHSVAYLRAKQVASVHFRCTQNFRIRNITMGLSYLLGKCEY